MKAACRVLAVVGGSALVITATTTPVRAEQAGQGRLGREAFQQRLLERHPEADANADGQLSRDEIMAFVADHPELRQRAPFGRRFGQFRQALRQRAQEVLAQNPDVDLNDNGRLDPNEAREFFKTHPGAFGQRLLERRPELDTDGDGLLSFDEARAGMLKRFPRLDADGDGVLTEKEVDVARERMKERRRARLLERFPQADTDGDGTLSDAEVRAVVQSRISATGRE